MPMISNQTRLTERLMKITRSRATMNGKFESSSNNQDESNLNRLCSRDPLAHAATFCSRRHLALRAVSPREDS
jgi:hypothetical protein